MSIDLAILVVCCAANAALGFLVFLRNPHQAGNRRFAALSTALILWTLFNYLSDHEPASNPQALLFTRLAFFGGVLAIFTVLNFIANFPSEGVFQQKVLWRAHRIFTALLLPLVFLPQFIKSVSGQAFNGSINTSYLYYVFIAYVAYSLLLLALQIRKQNQLAKSFQQKQQVLIVSWGIMLYAALAIISNVLIPLLVDNWSSSRFGPATTLLFLGMVAYSIAKHSLFDIRFVIARSVAYLLLLGSLSSIFAGIIFAITAIFLKDQHVNNTAKITYLVVSLFIALLLQPLRKFFDRITNRLFYRDAYDAQELLNYLNRSLVTTIDLEELLHKSAQVIENSIKPEFCYFVIQRPQEDQFSYIGNTKKEIAAASLNEIVATATKSIDRIIMADDIPPGRAHLKELFQQANISVFLKIHGRSKTSLKNLSYLVLGPKRSGGIYSDQDARVLEIIADELVIAIQNALRFEEIQKFNLTLQQKVEEATKELRHANSRLRELDKTKDEFISMASHQLRTPLTTVKGYLSMILEGDIGAVKKEQKELIQHAFDGANRMVYLIADLLNVSRLQSGKFVIEDKPTDLATVVDGEVLQLKEQALTRGVELVYDKPQGFPVLNLDETKIRQVVMNFLDNAIYYTPKGGKVQAVLESSPELIDFKVVDNGLGVPKSVQHHLFSKFYRADNARKMRPDGTGLGLFMAKKVVVAEGGAIIFKSEEGKGSTFGFSFPRKKMEAKGAAQPVGTTGSPLDSVPAQTTAKVEKPTPEKTKLAPTAKPAKATAKPKP